jgi:hypothetical protein
VSRENRDWGNTNSIFKLEGRKIQAKEQLIQEIEQAPDFLLEAVLNYLLFAKSRLSEKFYSPQSESVKVNNSLAGLLLTNQIR